MDVHSQLTSDPRVLCDTVQPVNSRFCWYLCLRRRSGLIQWRRIYTLLLSAVSATLERNMTWFPSMKQSELDQSPEPVFRPVPVERSTVSYWSELKSHHHMFVFQFNSRLSFLSSACSWFIFSDFFLIKTQHSYCTCRINVTADRSSRSQLIDPPSHSWSILLVWAAVIINTEVS